MNYLLNKLKIKPKMSLYFSQVNEDDLKKYYEYSLDNKSAEEINTHLRALFSGRISEIKILEKFKELESKLKYFEGKNEPENEYQKLSSEYNDIIDRANEIWKYNDNLLGNLRIKYKEIYNKTGKEGFAHLNKEILNNVVDSYIKFDKYIIIIKNKINDLINLII